MIRTKNNRNKKNNKMNGNRTNSSGGSKNSSLDDSEHDMGPKMPCPQNEAELLREW